MLYVPWDRVLERLKEYGCEIGEPANNRLPVSRPGFLEVTNLPTQDTCPDGLSKIVLRGSLRGVFALKEGA